MCGLASMGGLGLGLLLAILIVTYAVGIYGFQAIGLYVAYEAFRYIAKEPAAGVAVGAVLSIATTFAVESAKHPRLRLVLLDGGRPRPFVFRHDGRRELGHVLLAQVVNVPLLPDLRFLQRGTATEVVARICFRDRCGRQAFAVLETDGAATGPQETPLAMPVRWANTPQPARIVRVRTPRSRRAVPWEIADPERLVRTQRIRPASAEDEPGGVNDGTFSVAVRFQDDAACYGLTNMSYLHRFRPAGWRLVLPEYLVEVEVTSASGGCRGLYRLSTGTDSLEPFRLRPASRAEVRRVEAVRSQEPSPVTAD